VTERVFGEGYASAYDALYQDKDYLAECELIEHVFNTYGLGQIRRILDLGCGTGGHAVPLAERGYDVVGVDRSAAMLEHARARGSTARFERSDIASLHLDETFDAALLMFAVLGYHLANVDVQAALQAARRHLRPGAVLFFDVWYGPAVLMQRPGDRVKVIEAPDCQLIRMASSELDIRRHACTVHYRLWRVADGRRAQEVRESHAMRFFFPLELDMLLASAGFELVRLGSFPSLDVEPSENTWNVGVVARAV
jgi:SAM-dependent methyltransferase